MVGKTFERSVITTVIPTYRRPHLLQRAIHSVLDQTYPHVQVVVYDNASCDETADVVSQIARADARVKYVCHSKNIGAVANFQSGLDAVETPFFSFLSDDDFLLSPFYETALQALKRFPEAAFFAGAVIDENERGEAIDIILSRWPDKEYFTAPEGLLEMIGKYSNWTGILFRTRIVESVGPLDPDVKAIDVDYLFRIAARFPFVISKVLCAVFVQHEGSYSGRHGLDLIWPGWEIMISKIKANPHLRAEVKEIAELKLRADFCKLLVMNAFRSIERKKWEEAKAIVDVFAKQEGRRQMALGLATAVKMCQAVPFMQRLCVLLLRARRFCKYRGNS